MIVVGELINGSREPVQQAILSRDEEAIAELAVSQSEAGADYLDCNVGMVGRREAEHMRWLVEVVARAVDTPIAVDTANPDAMAAGLDAWPGRERAILNSITLENERLEHFVPLIREREVRVIALTMGNDGVPATAEGRVDVAMRLLDALEAAGVTCAHIFVDPVVTPLSVDPGGARVACEAMREIASRCPDCHLICGVSNVSYGLPRRRLLNRIFLAQATISGLDSAILDPLDAGVRSTVYAAEALAGRDEWCAGYLQAWRRGELQ
ncbi:MAG: dihydropteroate synthase [Armatimonadota bacterium]|nr:dihydropteroate synthase [Armatimonadota bacterium]